MECEHCGEAPATVHQITINNGFDVQYKHLCEKCANELENGKKKDTSSGKVPGLIASMFDEQETMQCSQCGLTFDEFSDSGRLGCANCYSAFSKRLEPLIKRIHGSSSHEDDSSESKELGKLSMARKIQILEKELEKQIKEENYEKAAVLRDRIAELKENLVNANSD
jgi:protein arginine kinase activator